ncbi:penicillin-binding protein 2 [Candidatus Saccharibacteria bacterium]|nr:penicillin-binding protein 2 [Candidatus Saccharibacteria bacterium]
MAKMTRIGWLKVGLVLAVAVIGVRLFQVQIIEHGKYMAAAESEHMRKFELLAERGQIYMLDGNKVVPVVMNERVWTVFVDPSYVGNESLVKEKLDEILGKKIFASWDEVFKDKSRQYYEVAKEVTWTEISQVEKANLKGVGRKMATKRVYPYGELASQVLGFVNANNVGYGAEGALNKDLAGENGVLKTVADVNNIPLTIGDNNIEVPAVNGKNVALSIDMNVQRTTEKILAEAIGNLGADYASAVVMNPQTGRIYAMANLPTYNPEEYWKVSDANVYRNRILEDPYEPASVMKTFTFAQGIELGKMKPTDTYTNTGTTVVEDRTIRNLWQESDVRGTISFQTALNYSLNTGSIEVLRRLDGGKITKKGRELLYEAYHDKFGFGKKTGIEMYESAGTVVGPNEGYGLNVRYANMTFGQGLDVTMMQIAAAFCSVINGGEFFTPTVVAGEVINGVLVERAVKPAAWRAITDSTSTVMRDMLIEARQKSGMAWMDLPGYVIGGKSGTAETLKDGKYTSDPTIASYMGFGGASADLPEYVVMVRISGEGKTLQGGAHAAPIFTKISNYMLEYLKIRPEV